MIKIEIVQMTKLSKISILVFILSFVGQLAVSNHVAVKTRELNAVYGKITEFQNQISILNQEIYLSSSIAGMEQKAKDQGFVFMQVQVKSIVEPVIARAF